MCINWGCIIRFWKSLRKILLLLLLLYFILLETTYKCMPQILLSEIVNIFNQIFREWLFIWSIIFVNDLIILNKEHIRWC